MYRIMMKLTDTLSEDKSKVLIVRFWEDHKFSEISVQIGKSEDAVKIIFYGSIEVLKICFRLSLSTKSVYYT